MVGVPLAIGFGAHCCVAAVFRVLGRRSSFIAYALGIVFVAYLLAHVIWFRRNAPSAIVANSEFLGITSHGDQQRRIPWSSIFFADHSTKRLGMQWELRSISAGTTILRDVGIDAGRWGILWAIVIEPTDGLSVCAIRAVECGGVVGIQ